MPRKAGKKSRGQSFTRSVIGKDETDARKKAKRLQKKGWFIIYSGPSGAKYQISLRSGKKS